MHVNAFYWEPYTVLTQCFVNFTTVWQPVKCRRMYNSSYAELGITRRRSLNGLESIRAAASAAAGAQRRGSASTANTPTKPMPQQPHYSEPDLAGPELPGPGWTPISPRRPGAGEIPHVAGSSRGESVDVSAAAMRSSLRSIKLQKLAEQRTRTGKSRCVCVCVCVC